MSALNLSTLAPPQPMADASAAPLDGSELVALCRAGVKRMTTRYRMTLSIHEREDLVQDVALVALRRFGVRTPAGATVIPAGAMSNPVEYLALRARALAARSPHWRDTLERHRTHSERQRDAAPMVAPLEHHAADADTAAILAHLPADAAPLAAGDWHLSAAAADALALRSADAGGIRWTPGATRKVALALCRALSDDGAAALAAVAAEQGCSAARAGNLASDGAALLRAAFTPAAAAAIVRRTAERYGYVLPSSGQRPVLAADALAACEAVTRTAAAAGGRIAPKSHAAPLLDTCWRERDADPAGASCPLWQDTAAARWQDTAAAAAERRSERTSALLRALPPRQHRQRQSADIDALYAAYAAGVRCQHTPTPSGPRQRRSERTDPVALLAASYRRGGPDHPAILNAPQSIPAAGVPTERRGTPTPVRYPVGLCASTPTRSGSGWRHDTADTAPLDASGQRLCGCPSCREQRAAAESIGG